MAAVISGASIRFHDWSAKGMPTETTNVAIWRSLAETDPEIAGVLRDERLRQNNGLELIASENFVSRAVLEAAGTVLGMNLAHGGHLTHGHPLNFSGLLYTIVPYGVRQADERIDYDELDALADRHQPKMIIVGASAYPRVIDFSRIRATATR